MSISRQILWLAKLNSYKHDKNIKTGQERIKDDFTWYYLNKYLSDICILINSRSQLDLINSKHNLQLIQ